MYINIHSHHHPDNRHWAVRNLHEEFDHKPEKGLYSAGLHPWHIKADTWQQQLYALKKASSANNIVAIGECGLDKVCTTAYQLQEEVFIAQLLWANEVKKPLIIHCVRAYEEILHLLHINDNKVPVIFHGFNKNQVLAHRVLKAGHWLSFGKALMTTTMHAVFLSVPHNRFFLETDDTSLTIEQVYEAAAAFKNISTEALDLQLRKNVMEVFNITVQ